MSDEDSSSAHFRQTADERLKPADPPGPKRVLPLAIVAVIAAVLVAGVTSTAIWALSGHRYAAQVITGDF